MNPWRTRNRIYLGTACLALCVGCQQPGGSIDELKRRIPARPAQLDRLDMLEGEWETEGTIKMIGMDEPFRTTGTSRARWSVDRWLLIDESEYDMGPLGKMSGVSIWTWDDRAKCYRHYWFDSFGERAMGKARYDESAKTWHLKTSGRSALCNVKNKGTIKLLDDGRLEWTYDQWDAWGFLKFAEMRGTSRRE